MQEQGTRQRQRASTGRAALRSVEPERPKALPRGPHALPQEVVIAHQRERLLEAAAEAMAEVGYADLSVKDMIDGAGVSRRTFYQLFEGKLECVLAAHAAALDHVTEAISKACSTQVSWPDGVTAGVAAALDFAARSPAEARLVLLATHTVSEPALFDAALEAHGRLSKLLRAGRKLGGETAPGKLTESAVIGGVTAIVGAKLTSGQIDGLRKLGPELIQIILAPYVGHEEAQRLAAAA